MNLICLICLCALAAMGGLLAFAATVFLSAWLVHNIIEQVVVLFKCQKAIIRFIMCGQDARNTIMTLTRDNHRLREQNADLEEGITKLLKPTLDDDTDELPIVVGEDEE